MQSKHQVLNPWECHQSAKCDTKTYKKPVRMRNMPSLNQFWLSLHLFSFQLIFQIKKIKALQHSDNFKRDSGGPYHSMFCWFHLIKQKCYHGKHNHCWPIQFSWNLLKQPKNIVKKLLNKVRSLFNYDAQYIINKVWSKTQYHEKTALTSLKCTSILKTNLIS